MADNEINFILSADVASGSRNVQNFTQNLKTMGVEGVRSSESIAQSVNKIEGTTTTAVSALDDLRAHIRSLIEETKQSTAVVEGVAASTEQVGKGAVVAMTNAAAATRGLAAEMTTLSGAISGVALIGVVELLGQIPALYENWDEAAKKAYADVSRDNQQAYEELQRFQLKLAEIRGTGLQEREKQVAEQERDVTQDTLEAVRLRNLANTPTTVVSRGIVRQTQNPQHDDLMKQADEVEKRAQEGLKKLTSLRQELTTAQVAADKKEIDDNIDAREKEAAAEARIYKQVAQDKLELARFYEHQRVEFLIRSTADLNAQAEILARENVDRVLTYEQKQIIAQTPLMNRAKAEALRDAEASERYYASKGNDEYKKNLDEQIQIKDTALKQLYAAEEANSKFINNQLKGVAKSFNDSLGKVWDDFYIRGTSILGSLADFAKGIFDSIGRSAIKALSNLALTGSAGGVQNGQAVGGLLGAAAHIPAFAKLMGFGGAAGSAITMGAGGSIIMGSTTIAGGVLAPTAAPMVLGGLGAAAGTTTATSAGLLGAHGALAGFFTNPWTIGVGAAILGSFAIWKHFHHKSTGPMTPDPLAADRSRTMWFNSTYGFERLNNTLTKIDATLGDVSSTMQQFSTMDNGTLMKNGFAAIKDDVKETVVSGMDDSDFRRAVAGGVLELSI